MCWQVSELQTWTSNLVYYFPALFCCFVFCLLFFPCTVVILPVPRSIPVALSCRLDIYFEILRVFPQWVFFFLILVYMHRCGCGGGGVCVCLHARTCVCVPCGYLEGLYSTHGVSQLHSGASSQALCYAWQVVLLPHSSLSCASPLLWVPLGIVLFLCNLPQSRLLWAATFLLPSPLHLKDFPLREMLWLFTENCLTFAAFCFPWFGDYLRCLIKVGWQSLLLQSVLLDDM